MELFGGALASIGSHAWTTRTLPAMPGFTMPAMGSVDIPAMPEFTIPEMPNVQIPAEGMVQIPALEGFEMPPMPSGVFDFNKGFRATFDSLVSGLTGTGGSIVPTPAPFDMSALTQQLQMPSWATNPFVTAAGVPNPFFGAQFSGNCSTFYTAFSDAFSIFRQA